MSMSSRSFGTKMYPTECLKLRPWYTKWSHDHHDHQSGDHICWKAASFMKYTMGSGGSRYKQTNKPIHPGRLTAGTCPKMEVWFRSFSFLKWVICRFHVNLPGCIFFASVKHKTSPMSWSKGAGPKDVCKELEGQDLFYKVDPLGKICPHLKIKNFPDCKGLYSQKNMNSNMKEPTCWSGYLTCRAVCIDLYLNRYTQVRYLSVSTFPRRSSKITIQTSIG